MSRFVRLSCVLLAVIAFDGVFIDTFHKVNPAMAEIVKTASARNDQLVNAIYERDISAVEAALRAGADIEAATPSGGTPALLAAQIDAWDICLHLLQSGARADVRSQNGKSTIAKRAASSRVVENSKEGQALSRVRQILKAKGL